MKTFILFFLILLSYPTLAQDYAGIAKILYPNSVEQQNLFKSFGEVVKNHKRGQDPLLQGKGPGVSSYQLHKTRFAFLTNIKSDSVDLVIFNWDLDLFEGLEKEQKLSELYENPVYILKNINPKEIATQGDNRDEMSNFSYINGTNYYSAFVRKFGLEASNDDGQPHPAFMSRNHPLRKSLDKKTIVLLSPDENVFYKSMGVSTEEDQVRIAESFQTLGGISKVLLGMMIHEMYHIKEFEDTVLDMATRRSNYPDRDLLRDQLDDPKLKEMISTYTGIIFKIGQNLVNKEDSRALLSQLAVVISELKTKFPNAWKYIWDFEYSEGFAEYASAQSLIEANIFPLSKTIELSKQDSSNNVVYRTGAMGGLYLRNSLGRMPFANLEDHSQSVWEIIIDEEKALPSGKLEDIIREHKISEAEFELEIELIKDYL